MNRSRKIVLLFLLFFMMTACREKLKKVEMERFAFGTFFKIVIYSENKLEAKRYLEEAFKEIERIDNRYNSKKKGSLIDILNGKGEMVLDLEGIEILKKVRDTYFLSGKRYDVTIEPLLEVWGLTESDNQLKELPKDEILKIAQKKVDFSKIEVLENGKVTAKDGIKIDTGSFLKGYAIEKAKEKLVALGVKNGFISAVSSIATIGTKGNGESWRIGLQNPSNLKEILGVVELNNKSLGVSGDYQNYIEIAGKKYHHILDKESGYPVKDKKMVAVLCEDSFKADLYSTAFFLMDDKEIFKAIEKMKEVEVLIVKSNGEIIKSKNFNIKTSFK